ncbi:hypothetical protein B0H17DRAFT_197270 [Mycena rosella]|uniref:F-box domain-containing protein n=1 Tax=Mycena rosella TaxID=1033263 RepID=A0AAD7CZE9_MYCRO|nr:hypothetical protein B0H17DRAFT_197270 [Mycena rosella]
MPPEQHNLPLSNKSGPVFVLPFEIISEIFLHCLPDNHTIPDTSQPPLLLGRICSMWRDVALATPKLWASLSIHCTDTADVRLADLWLSRARGYPLRIEVDDHEGEESPNREILLETICRYSAQWQEVTLSVPLDALSRLRLEGPLPRLERLVIGSEASVSPIQLVTAFSDAPLLREVHLSLDDVGSVQPRSIVLPWAQLTSFTGHLLSAEECLYVLREASSLTECNLYHFIDGHPGFTMSLPLVLPLITKLRLEGSVEQNLVDVLQYLTLPALEFLELRTAPPSTENPATNPLLLGTLITFLPRSSCPLLEFRLITSRTLHTVLFQCLSAMPTLKVLDITWFSTSHHVHNTILQQLHTPSALLPHLQSLSVHYTTPPVLPYDDELIAMLFSRSNRNDTAGAARLERFSLSWNGFHLPYPDAQTLDRFKALLGRGMQIHLGPLDAPWI